MHHFNVEVQGTNLALHTLFTLYYLFIFIHIIFLAISIVWPSLRQREVFNFTLKCQSFTVVVEGLNLGSYCIFLTRSV